jgi:hypothetical protein
MTAQDTDCIAQRKPEPHLPLAVWPPMMPNRAANNWRSLLAIGPGWIEAVGAPDGFKVGCPGLHEPIGLGLVIIVD